MLTSKDITREVCRTCTLSAEGPLNSAPRLWGAGEAAAAAGADLCLPCAATDHPPPHYT
jgi:hypothetical protein